jgi:hypothetical protein
VDFVVVFVEFAGFDDMMFPFKFVECRWHTHPRHATEEPYDTVSAWQADLRISFETCHAAGSRFNRSCRCHRRGGMRIFADSP